MSEDQQPAPTIFVLYGATGDLAARMVLPAFYRLAQEGMLPPEWRLVGNGRGDVAHEDFRGHVKDVLTEFADAPEDPLWSDFAGRLLFAGGGFDEDNPGSLLDVLDQARSDLGGDPQHVHYLAVPPVAFGTLTKGIDAHGLAEGSRVVYEKPYGTSPESFEELDELVLSVLKEEQVYRIDHFLGKEGTQDLHVLRFANGLYNGIWSREHIESVQIDIPETLDVANRASFYDATGALRDMIVTHLFQVAAEVAMEPPTSMSALDLQSARESVLDAFRPLSADEVVLGQFEGYRDIEGVPDDSDTDTFVAARLWVDTERWRGVPFLLRTGKRLAESHQQVSLVFRNPDGPFTHLPERGNVLTFVLEGGGGIVHRLVLKRPGGTDELDVACTDLPLTGVEGGNPLPPYVTLLHDVLIGDRSLFTSSEGVGQGWRVAGPILTDPPAVQSYAPGSWGPAAATGLAGPQGWLLGS